MVCSFCLHSYGSTEENANILAIAILFTKPMGNNIESLSLYYSLDFLQQRLAPFTPSKVYIFHRKAPMEEYLNKLQKFNVTLNITFSEIPASQWIIPEVVEQNRSKFTFLFFDDDYRLMGQWRLLYPFKFMKELGHKYLLFLDDDSYIRGDVRMNLVETAKQHNYNFMPLRMLHEDRRISGYGDFPLMAKDFCMKHNIKAPLLLEDCSARDWSGVTTDNWRGTIMYGNFVVISIDFWFHPLLQEFLDIIIKSGKYFIYRWNEQLVIAMMRLIFSNHDKETILSFPYNHGNRFGHIHEILVHRRHKISLDELKHYSKSYVDLMIEQ